MPCKIGLVTWPLHRKVYNTDTLVYTSPNQSIYGDRLLSRVYETTALYTRRSFFFVSFVAK